MILIWYHPRFGLRVIDDIDSFLSAPEPHPNEAEPSEAWIIIH